MWNQFKWYMFITSFIPLWFTIIFIDVWEIITLFKQHSHSDYSLKFCFYNCLIQIITIIVILIIVSISIIKIESFLHKRENAKNDIAIIKSARKESTLSTQYLLSYIFPLIAFDFGDLKDIVIFLIFFLVLAFLCIRYNNIYTNIYLEFRRFKIYSCDIERTILDQKNVYTNCFVLSKDDLEQYIDERISYWDFDEKHYIIPTR